MSEGRNDFKQEWPKIKKQLFNFSKQAVDMAQKGEEEFVRLSQKGKLHLNATTLSLKKNYLHHLIGQEYTRAKCPAAPTPKLKQLIEKVNKIDQEKKIVDRQIKSKRYQ